jgi:hypothetical protein
VFALDQSSAIGGTSLGFFCTLYDGATAQCTVMVRSDGAVLLTAGTNAGAVLATSPPLISAINIWYAIEVEVVISASAGSFAVRRNGNNVNDFSATGLNTQASANAYANKLQIGGVSNGVTHMVDDLWWRSGAAAGSWLGDLRCYTRMPVTDSSVHFSPAGVRNVAFSGVGGNAAAANRVFYTFLTAPADSQIVSATMTTIAAYTGNVKCSVFADSAGSPGTVLGSAANTLANPASGVQTFTFSTPIAVTNGQKIWLGFCYDTASAGSITTGASSGGWFGTTAYASFPVASPTGLTANQLVTSSINFSGNAVLVNEAPQDGGATYVYDSTAGDADFYAIAALPSPITPFTTVGTITRAFMQKTDAGSRTGAVQLKSGATVVASPTLSLAPGSGFQWASRLDLVDPNTGAAWAAAAVNAAQIGPLVVT